MPVGSVDRMKEARVPVERADALHIGSHEVWPPVVLAPMAGVTNAPFRSLCRRFGPGLLYVNEMVMTIALIHGNAKTERMITFAPDESPRSLQLYGSDPASTATAIRRLGEAGRVDHIDLNFGCPAAKVTRRGGGAAVPLKRHLLRAIVRAAFRPSLFAELRQEYGDSPPKSDEYLRAFLLKRGFVQGVVDVPIRTYRDTMTFVQQVQELAGDVPATVPTTDEDDDMTDG